MLLLSKFKISGHSMEPLFLHGDKILTTNIFYLFKSPQINDIVVFKDITNVFVKRITKIIDFFSLLLFSEIHLCILSNLKKLPRTVKSAGSVNDACESETSRARCFLK